MTLEEEWAECRKESASGEHHQCLNNNCNSWQQSMCLVLHRHEETTQQVFLVSECCLPEVTSWVLRGLGVWFSYSGSGCRTWFIQLRSVERAVTLLWAHNVGVCVPWSRSAVLTFIKCLKKRLSFKRRSEWRVWWSVVRSSPCFCWAAVDKLR